LELLIPLLIAYKARNSAHNFEEINKAGTMLAVINVGYFVTVFAVYLPLTNISSVFQFDSNDDKYRLFKIERGIIIVLMLVSLVPTHKIVKQEYQNFDWRS